MENNDFECAVCSNNLCEEVYSNDVLHPLWWKGEEYSATRLRYVICTGCGFVTQFPPLHSDIISKYYKHSETPSRDSFLQRVPLFKDRKDFIFEEDTDLQYGRVIEVGAAYGDFLALLTEFNERIAIEPSVTYGQTLKQLGSDIQLVPNLLEEMDQFEIDVKESADLVVAAHVLEHTSDPYGFVSKLLSMVKENGYLMLEVPSLEEFSHCEKPIFQNFFFGHLHHFSLETLNMLCLSHSLSYIKSDRTRDDSYPVIRVLYQKRNMVAKNTARFNRCMDIMRSEYEVAIKQLLQLIADTKEDKVLIWGCGDDLIRLVGYLSDSQLDELKHGVVLCDRSAQKQNRELFGMKISSPELMAQEPFSDVVVAVKSQILSKYIVADAEVLFPNATVSNLF